MEDGDDGVTIVHKRLGKRGGWIRRSADGDGSVLRIFGFCACRGRECIENLRALCLAGMGVYRESSGFVLGGDRLAGPAQKPTPPEDNSAAGL